MSSGISRRDLVRSSAALAATGGVAQPQGSPRRRRGVVDPDSTFFSTTFVESAPTVLTDSDGDLWPSCWADDDNVYTANGDGRGFGEPIGFLDIALSRVSGTPETDLTGDRVAHGDALGTVWANPADYNRKPTGMLAVDGNGDGSSELYMAIQDLRTPPCPECFNDAPNASISRSDDYGETWQITSEPMFTDHVFTTIFFLDFGKANENVGVLGEEGARYVYAYGIDFNWRDPTIHPEATTDLYLARVPKESIQDRSAWEFFAGTRGPTEPRWVTDIRRRRPVLRESRTVYPKLRCDGRPIDDPASDVHVISQGSVVYNAPLERYIYTSWTWYTFEFYEAPTPWGPWRLFLHKDWGATAWPGLSEENPKAGGYPTTIPSKYISDDGKTMWVVTSNWVRWRVTNPNYNFGLRKLEVETFEATEPENEPDPTNNLAMTGEGTTPIEKSGRFGRSDWYNDGNRERHESSFDCEADKPTDFWGYTWNRAYNIDRVVYTGGRTFFDGGWFDTLTVQVRQDFQWCDVRGLSIDPPYPSDESAGPNRTFEISFDPTWGDGVRIIGKPGGSAGFTTIGELEVYFTGEQS